MHHFARFSVFVALLLPFFVSAGCGGGGGGGGPAPGTVQLTGMLSALLPDPTTLEAEPNDTLEQAHKLGDLRAGSTLAVIGSIMETGTDTSDIFEFRAPERVLVDLNLNGISTMADLDVFVVDPVGLQMVQRYVTMSASEAGTFAVQGTFFVMIDAFSQDSDYELTLAARAISGPIAEIEPNNAATTANYLGTLRTGQTLEVAGDGATSDDDFFLFAAPDGTSFTFNLQSAAGNDYDVSIFDATMSLMSPTLVGTFDDSGNTETGTQPISGMTLFAFAVEPFMGASAPYTLSIANNTTLTARASLQGNPRLSASRRGSLDQSATLTRGVEIMRAASKPQGPTVRGDVIVKYKNSAVRAARLQGPEAVADVLAAVPNGAQKLRFPIPASLSDAEAARYSFALAATLRGRPDVEYAEQDDWVTLFSGASAAISAAPFSMPQGTGGTRPNDTNYNLQWHYEQIQLPAAWDITTGSNSVRTAVLDTGSAPSSDLTPRTVQGVDMISDPSIAGDGNGVDDDPTDVGDGTGPQPSSFHGAHVAGTIGAASNNGRGVAGVTWAGQIFHVRVLGIGGGSSFDIANGVLYAAGLPNSSNRLPSSRADIINMSLGGPGFNQTFQNAVTDAFNAGVTVIAAAGNENSSTPSFPAAYDGVISVAAVDYNRQRAPYSNFHASVDIAAPGGDVSVDRNGDGYADGVLSTKPDDSVSPTNFESFSFYQGTSMAAPHVAGVAGLILAVNPGLSPSGVENALRSTATDLGAPGRDDQYGSGLVNAFSAVQSAQGGGGTTPILSVNTGNVLIETVMGTQQVGVANVGGGSLQITNVVAATMSGGDWLAAQRVITGQAGTTDTSAVEITANGSGLADGNYTGTVTVDSNGGTQMIAVTLRVGNVAPLPDLEIFVLAVDAVTFQTLAQAVVRTTGTLGYELGSLVPGTYVIVAGTDVDNDDFICDEGEPLCGVYPSLELAEAIELMETSQRIDGLDFPLQSVNLPTSSGRRVGFRRLDRPEGAR